MAKRFSMCHLSVSCTTLIIAKFRKFLPILWLVGVWGILISEQLRTCSGRTWSMASAFYHLKSTIEFVRDVPSANHITYPFRNRATLSTRRWILSLLTWLGQWVCRLGWACHTPSWLSRWAATFQLDDFWRRKVKLLLLLRRLSPCLRDSRVRNSRGCKATLGWSLWKSLSMTSARITVSFMKLLCPTCWSRML